MPWEGCSCSQEGLLEKSSHEEIVGKPQLRNILQIIGLYPLKMLLVEGKNWSRSKKTKETWKQNATCDSGLDLRSEEKNCSLGHSWDQNVKFTQGL